MAPTSRFHSAIQAMKNIGIPSRDAKPVLRHLLKVYDNKWDLIEDESYRLLADAIFEWQERQEQEAEKSLDDKGSEKEVEFCEYELPLTRSGLRIEEPPSSPTAVPRLPYHDIPSSSKKPIVEEPTPLKRRPRLRLEEAPDSTPAIFPCLPYEEASSSKLSMSKVVSTQSTARERGIYGEESFNPSGIKRQKIESTDMDPFFVSSSNPVLSPNRTSNDYGYTYVDCTMDLPTKNPTSSSRTHAREHVEHFNPSPLRTPKSEPLAEVPICAVQPQSPTTYDKRNCSQSPCHSLEALATLYSDDEENKEPGNNLIASSDDMNCEIVSAPGCPMYYEIASTSLGEVKLALSCCPDRAGPVFHMPSLDAVLQLAEDRAMKSYKIHGPGFSMMNLMKDVCECFLELATDTSEKQERITTVAPMIDALKLKKKNLYRAYGSVQHDLHSSLERILPHFQQHIVLNCVEGLRRRGKADQKIRKYENLKEETESLVCKQNTEIVLVEENNGCFGAEKPLHDIYDISKGEEKIRIPVVNEVSSEPYPPLFHYIPTNHVYWKAMVNFSLARIGDEDCCGGCFGDCLLESIPCACARETGGEYAYTLDGLVKKEFLDDAIYLNREPEKHGLLYCRDCPLERSNSNGPCKGHLVRRFIKECWSKCGCSKQCGNRVVQRGITTNLQVFFTPEGKGWGLRTLESLPRGAFVCEYVGEVMTITELFDRNKQGKRDENHTYPVLMDADWGSERILKDEEALCLDATYYGNVSRFINHRCFDATLVEIPVEIETPDGHYYHLAFFTTREVEALEELTWDYGIDFDDVDHAIKRFQCLCGSQICRDPKRRSRMKQLQLTLNGR